MKNGYFTLPATLALLSGCVTTGPDYTAPTPTDPRLTSIVDAPEYESVAGTLLEARWWDRFNDPRLTALIETAAAANTDVRLAVFRIEEARAGRENITIAARTVQLTSLLVEQDLSPEFDLVRARAELTELSARINPLLAGQHAAMARIAFLTGQEPAAVSAALLSEGPQLIPSARIPVGLPSDILRRRPDIRAAERRLCAALETSGALA